LRFVDRNFFIKDVLSTKRAQLPITAKFVTAADFGARPCRTWPS
jgi:hypothetical protein